ncbi:hypothetical protein [Nitrosospira sp. Nsp13]|uniref:hypothetical protein n=1 Tax=Nitrosospira sp. Nsp13 TaxID=1855332 RepID=UPI0008835D03|nr:hypothetical protein [Nitrosospira sp. Nsp13]SCX87847.1 PEP-CTERM protein-sorting domain-containing protein [Nitrosospira sp. Nsp13]
MNKFRYGLVIGLGSISIGLSQGAIAAPITAAATIDWGKLQLVFTSLNDSGSAVTFGNYQTSLSSHAGSNEMTENNSKSASNWTSTMETNADAGTAHADASASSLSFLGNAMATNGSTTSSGSRTLDFSADGPGILTVTVPYTLSLTGDSDCYYCYNHATVSGNASFNNYIENGSASNQSNVSYSLTDYYWNPSPDSQAGSLVFGVVTSGAGYGSLSVGFDLSAQTASVVPEPQTYAMLLAGLMLIGRIARCRSMSFT